MKQFPLLITLLISCLCPAFGLEWAGSLEEAKARAAAQGKLVLALFYGSEFTRNSANMREGFMDGERFCDYAREKFIAVEMYEPRDRVQHAAFIWKYRALCQEYGIRRWPTTLVLTPQGIPTGGIVGSWSEDVFSPEEEYRIRSEEERLDIICGELDKGVAVAQKLHEAEALPTGEEQLRALAEAYKLIPQSLVSRVVFAQYVAERDPENKTGLRDACLDIREMIEWGQLGRYGMPPATTLRRMQEMIDKARPANLLTMLEQRYNVQSHHLNNEEDRRALEQAMEAYATELEKTDPAGAAERRAEHARLFHDEANSGIR